MTRDELLLDIKNVSFSETVCQTEILTQADIDRYKENTNIVPTYTLEQFQAEYPTIPADRVFYGPALAMGSYYYNKETMAICSIRLEYTALLGETHKQQVIVAIDMTEKDANEGNFMMGALSICDKMRMEYVQEVARTKADVAKDLYSLFFGIYTCSDYGFGSIDKRIIDVVMSKKTAAQKQETQKHLANLPDVFEVYRGGNDYSTPCENAYSWTVDINTANFFAARLGKTSGYIARGRVRKEDVLEAYIEDNSEAEIIIQPEKVEVLEIIDLYGFDFLKDAIPEVSGLYHVFCGKLDELRFQQQSAAHGKQHEKRVLLLCLIMARELGLSPMDTAVLGKVAVYHDTMRINDGKDDKHGERSMKYYEKNEQHPDPIVSLICKYHCLDDKLLQQAITKAGLDKERSRITCLFNVFKDADALDRVRFGIRDLDMNYLRLPIAKKMTLAAKLILASVE